MVVFVSGDRPRWHFGGFHVERETEYGGCSTFFRQAVAVVGHVPEQGITDGHTSYPRAICETMGRDVLHRKKKYLNNTLEQDHRGIKQRYSPMRGFGTFEAAARFCCAFDELRNDFHSRHMMGDSVPLPEQRQAFLQRLAALQAFIQAAS